MLKAIKTTKPSFYTIFFISLIILKGNHLQGISQVHPLDSIEYKLLITQVKSEKTSSIEDIEQAISEATSKADVIFQEDSKKKTREVYFLETQNRDLFKSDFTLRHRRRIKKGKAKKKYTLTLKYKSTSAQQTARKKELVWLNPNDEVRDLLKGDPKQKLEKDVVLNIQPNKPSSMNTFYSYSTKVKLKKSIRHTIEEMGKIFPLLLDLGLPTIEPLQRLGQIVINETKHTMGTIAVTSEQVPAKIIATIWQKPTVQTIKISFGFDASDVTDRTAVDQSSQLLLYHLAQKFGANDLDRLFAGVIDNK